MKNTEIYLKDGAIYQVRNSFDDVMEFFDHFTECDYDFIQATLIDGRRVAFRTRDVTRVNEYEET